MTTLTMNKKIAGFTFLELIIVIIVMGVIAINVFNTWPATPINLAAEVNQLADDIRYTQSLAMTKNQRYRLVITSSTQYAIQNSSGTPIVLALGNTTMTLPSGSTFGTLTGLPNNLVNFDSLGSPYTDTATPGTALAVTASIPITANGQTRTVTIAPGTGRVTVP
jgi:Tfp pilus assembly protein FimT